MSTPVLAQCSCGGFKFKSVSEPARQLTCHCQHCREVSKTPSTNFAFFKLADTEVEGKTVVHNFIADSGANTVRETCANCGEMLFDRTESFPGVIGIVAERIQPPFEFQSQFHVWMASKSDDAVVPEGMKTFVGGSQ